MLIYTSLTRNRHNYGIASNRLSPAKDMLAVFREIFSVMYGKIAIHLTRWDFPRIDMSFLGIMLEPSLM